MRSSQIQSSSFSSVVIGTGPDFTVVASLKLVPGSWVVFATVALGSATSVIGTTIVEVAFQLDGKLYGTTVQSDACIGARRCCAVRQSAFQNGLQRSERCWMRRSRAASSASEITIVPAKTAPRARPQSTKTSCIADMAQAFPRPNPAQGSDDFAVRGK
jgi:hypothetical protein